MQTNWHFINSLKNIPCIVSHWAYIYFFSYTRVEFQTNILLEKSPLGTFVTFCYRDKSFLETIIYIRCLINIHEQVQLSSWDEWISVTFVQWCVLFKWKWRRISSSALILWKISWVTLFHFAHLWFFLIQELKCPDIILLEKL